MRTNRELESSDTNRVLLINTNLKISHIYFVITVIYFLYVKFMTNTFLAGTVGTTLPLISLSHKLNMHTGKATVVMALKRSYSIPSKNK